MVGKKINEKDYLQLLRVIYKFSSFNPKKAKILVYYVMCQILYNKFDSIYLSKLEYDTGIGFTDESLANPNKYREYLMQMEKSFKHLEIIEIKSLIFDVMTKAYRN